MAIPPVHSLMWRSDRFMAKEIQNEDHDEKAEKSKRSKKDDKENSLTLRENLSISLKTIRDGATRTLDSMKERLDNFSQKLKRKSTRRRFRLEQSPYTPTHGTLNDRTPVKMYSPFGIITPENHDSEVHFCKRGLFTPRKCEFDSPTGKFGDDLKNFNRGSHRFQQLARNIVKRKIGQTDQ